MIIWYRPWDPNGKGGKEYPPGVTHDTRVWPVRRDGFHLAQGDPNGSPACTWHWGQILTGGLSMEIVKYGVAKYKKCN